MQILLHNHKRPVLWQNYGRHIYNMSLSRLVRTVEIECFAKDDHDIENKEVKSPT